MINLTVILDEVVLKTYEYDQDQKVITIGRDEENDLVLKDNAVSRHHAKIEAGEHGYLLTDLDSQNGVFINDKSIRSQQWLNNGDIIKIGRHSIKYSQESEEAAVDLMDQTMVLDTESQSRMRAESFLDNALGDGKNLKAELHFLDQSRQNLELSKKVITIGKSPDSDVVVKGLFVAKNAATISREAGGHYLNHIGILVKPKVDGSTVHEPILLRNSVIIEIGKLKMKYIVRK